MRQRPVRRAARLERVARRPGPRQRAAAQVVRDRPGDPVLDQRERPLGRPLRVEGARQGVGEERRVGEVDRRRGDLLAEPVRRAPPRPSAWSQPVESALGQLLEQRPDGARLHHHRVLARRQLRRLARRRPPWRPRARRAAVGSSADGRDRHAPRRSPSARPARCRSPSCRRRWCGRAHRPRRLSLLPRSSSATVHTPWASSARRSAAANAVGERVAAQRRVEHGGLGVVPVVGAGGLRRLEAGEGAGTGRCRGSRGALGAARRRRAAPRGPSEFVDARPTWPSTSTASSTSRRRRRWPGSAGCAAKRSISDRSRVTCASASAAGAAETAASASSRAFIWRWPSCDPHLDVAGSAPAPRRARRASSGPARPCRSPAPPGASTPTPSRRASQPAQKAGVWPA